MSRARHWWECRPAKGEPIPDDLHDVSIESLLDGLAAACARRGEALDSGDIKAANAEFDLTTRLSRELLKRGGSARDGILNLLLSKNPYMRLHAAFLVLEIDPAQAEPVFEEISRYKGLNLGFTAQFTLEQWRKGKLRTLSEWGAH
jgi:hypothetical protein